MSRAIFRSTSVVGAMTFLSRVTGLAREMLFAQLFGAGTLMDAFLVAFKIPNFLRRLFAEGAFSQAFVPVISEYKVQQSKESVRELVGGVAGTLGAMLFVITLAGVLAAPVVILIFAPGFTQTPGKYELAVHMLRFTFPYIFFISLTAFFSGVLNSYARFGVPAATQIVGNLVMIGAAITAAVYSDDPATTLAMGVFVSGLTQVAYQLPSVARLGLLAWPRWRPHLEGVRRIGRLMLPGIFGSSMAQVSLLLDVLIASFLTTGSIAWLYFADRLVEFPLGVFSIALATVILPGLSAHHAQQSPERFTATLDWAIRLVVLLATPAAVGLFALAGPLTATVYGYGQFAEHDVRMATYALMAYSWGLLGFSFVKVLAPGYFARQDTRTPVRTGIFALGVNMGLNATLVLPAYYWLRFPTPHVLLATSTCISAAVNAALLLRGLGRSGVYRPTQGWRMFLLRVVLANAAMGVLLVWLAGPLGDWISASALERTGRLAVLIAAGAAAYFAALYVLGLRAAHLRTEAPAPL